MIGELINQFEELPEQTVGEFNRIFPQSKITGYSNDAKVEIGEVSGNVRKIIINDAEFFWHELSHFNTEDNKNNGKNKPVQVFKSCGEFLGEFPSLKHAYFSLGYNQQTFYHAIKLGKFTTKEITCLN